MSKRDLLESQNALGSFNSLELLNPKSSNSIQIMQDGDDIRLEIDTNIEIVSNRTNDKTIISLSSKSPKMLTDSIISKNDDQSVPENNNNNKKAVKLRYLIDDSTNIDVLHKKAYTIFHCNTDRCLGSLYKPGKTIPSYERSIEEKISQAIDFINQFYSSVKFEGSKSHKERINEVIESLLKKGFYELKETELSFGARLAWRNASRCIGRIQWSKLQVFDARHITTARGMFEALCNHLKYGNNKGNIRSAITVFRQRTQQGKDFRVWNSQFINYAGFRMNSEKIIGDKSQIEFTEICIKLGWKPKYLEFEVLPLVLQANGEDPEWFEIPPELILEVDIIHPNYDNFKELKLKWFCVPGVSSMVFDVGGIEYPAAPFNGWYMGTEIGRDLADINRYDKLPAIAEKLGLDTKSNTSLWKDKALIELNHAILYSFQKSNTTIMDHHTASESFMKHYKNEVSLRGGCPADWVWIVPPLSSHLTPVFHLEMLNYILKPSFEYQDSAWKNHIWKQNNNNEIVSKKRRLKFKEIVNAVKFSTKLMAQAMSKRIKCTILYASETGKSENFAYKLSELFNHSFNAKVICMNDYDLVDLVNETLLLIVTSTFGNGDPPENGQQFKKVLIEMLREKSLLAKNNNVRFSVFSLGNSSYPKFCAFGKFLDDILQKIGAERVHEIVLGDELQGQQESFRKWSVGVFKSALETFCIESDISFLESISNTDSDWNPQTIRLTSDNSKNFDLCKTLNKLHGRKVTPCKLASKRNLQAENSGRVTLMVELSTNGYSSELQYTPGDHVGLFASNRKNLVDAILDKLSNAPPPDQMIKVEVLKKKESEFGSSKQWEVDDRYLPFTLRQAFTNFLDITSPLTQEMFKYLSKQATSDSDKKKLEKLSSDHIAYKEWKQNGNPNLAEVLEEFSSLKPNASLLITQLPKLQPRYYSISSSPKVTDDINVTVGVVEYTPIGRSTHYGVCSKWLDEIKSGDIIPSFIREAPTFRMPEDKTCPIIMVCSGTGLAPYRSFWQERKIDKQITPNPNGINGVGWGKMILYFGCRQKNVDELYRSEIDQMIKENVLNEFNPAYSREPNQKKVYVQEIMKKNGESLYDLIYYKHGHFYVCGDVRMAADVTEMLEKLLVDHSKSKLSLDDAKNYLNTMKENMRFHEDIFGNNGSDNFNN